MVSWLLLAGSAVASGAQPTNWPSFRGPGAAGVAAGVATATTWDVASAKNVRWKTRLAGLGHASPVIWGDRLFVTTAVSASGEASLKTGLYGDIGAASDNGVQDWKLLLPRPAQRQGPLGTHGQRRSTPGQAPHQGHSCEFHSRHRWHPCGRVLRQRRTLWLRHGRGAALEDQFWNVGRRVLQGPSARGSPEPQRTPIEGGIRSWPLPLLLPICCGSGDPRSHRPVGQASSLSPRYRYG